MNFDSPVADDAEVWLLQNNRVAFLLVHFKIDRHALLVALGRKESHRSRSFLLADNHNALDNVLRLPLATNNARRRIRLSARTVFGRNARDERFRLASRVLVANVAIRIVATREIVPKREHNSERGDQSYVRPSSK